MDLIKDWQVIEREQINSKVFMLEKKNAELMNTIGKLVEENAELKDINISTMQTLLSISKTLREWKWG